MSQNDSDELQHQLAKLLAKSRRLRGRSQELDEEILRVSRLIAGVEEAAAPPPGDSAPSRLEGSSEPLEADAPPAGTRQIRPGSTAPPRGRVAADQADLPSE